MSTDFIAAATAQADSAAFELSAGETVKVGCYPTMRPGETVILFESFDTGSNWVQVGDAAFNGVVIAPPRTTNTISGPGYFKLRKSTTTASVAIKHGDVYD